MVKRRQLAGLNLGGTQQHCQRKDGKCVRVYKAHIVLRDVKLSVLVVLVLYFMGLCVFGGVGHWESVSGGCFLSGFCRGKSTLTVLPAGGNWTRWELQGPSYPGENHQHPSAYTHSKPNLRKTADFQHGMMCSQYLAMLLSQII